MVSESQSTICVGDLRVVIPERRAYVRDRELDLTPREFDVLLGLASHPGWVLSAEQLTESSGPADYASPFAVNVHVSHLRAKLKTAGAPGLIETVRGAGWRLRRVDGPSVDSGTPFVGRTAEVDGLTSALGSSGPRFALVLGEPGIGKTMLVEQIITHTAPRFALARAICDANGSGDFWMWRQIVRELARWPGGPEITDVELVGQLLGDRVSTITPPPGQARSIAFDAVRVYLGDSCRAAARPVLIFVDDLQWADDASLALLDHVLRRLPSVGCAIVCACRTADARLRPALAPIVEYAAARASGHLLELGGLASRDIAAMAATAGVHGDDPVLVETLLTRTNGNPLFVRESLRAIKSAGPDALDRPGGMASLDSLVRTQVEALPKRTVDLLRTAACLGIEFDDTSAERIVGGRPADWEPAFQSELVTRTDRGMAFRHAIVRDTLVGLMQPAEREAAHRALADELRMVRPRTDEIVAQLAHHYGQGGPTVRVEAIGFKVAEARRSTACLAFEDATAHLEEALSLTDALPAAHPRWRRVRAAMLERAGSARASLGDYESALHLYERALSVRPDADRLARVRLLTRVSFAATGLRRLVESLDALERARALLEVERADDDAGWWHEWIEVHLARADAAVLMNTEPGFGELSRIEREVNEHGTPHQRAKFYLCLAEQRAMRDGIWYVNDQSLEAAHRAVEESADCSEYMRAWALSELGCQLAAAFRGAEAEEPLRKSLQLARRSGDVLGEQAALLFLCLCARAANDVLSTETLARKLETLAKEHATMPEFLSGADAHLAWVALRRERYDEAAERSGRALTVWLSEPACSQGVWMMAWPAVAVALIQGDTTRAIECSTLMTLRNQQALQGGLHERLRGVAAANATGDRDRARALLESLTAEARAYGYS